MATITKLHRDTETVYKPACAATDIDLAAGILQLRADNETTTKGGIRSLHPSPPRP